MVKRILLGLTLGAWTAGAAGADPRAGGLYLVTEHSPPASMVEEGKATGFAVEKVREIMQRAGVAYTVEVLPWKRAYTSALTRSDTCVFSTTRTPEREALFKWVGPTDAADWVLMGRADRQYGLRTLDDARELRIGTYNGDARDEYLRLRGFKVDPAPSDTINPKKLLANRIDLWAAVVRQGSSVLERNGWETKIVPVLVFNRVRVYLACNSALPNWLIERLNRANESIQKDGTARRLERRFEYPEANGQAAR